MFGDPNFILVDINKDGYLLCQFQFGLHLVSSILGDLINIQTIITHCMWRFHSKYEIVIRAAIMIWICSKIADQSSVMNICSSVTLILKTT